MDAVHAASAATTLRLSTWGASKAPQVTSFVAPFIEQVEHASGGRIKVENFPDGALVSEQDVPTAIQSKVVDISLTTLGSWASIVPEAGVLNTVFFSPTGEGFEKAIGPGTKLFKTLDAGMMKHDTKMLCALYNGPVVVVSRQPLNTPAAFRGKTIRVFDRLTAQIVQTLGGAPSTIGVADVYPALERGTVQGAIGGLEGAVGLKEYEVAKYVLATNGVFGLLITGYVMNLAHFVALSADLRKIVLDAAYQVGRTANQAMVDAYQIELDKMREHHATVTVLEPKTPNYDAFKAALAPLVRKEKAGFSPALVKTVLDSLQ
ncbi:TRAP transporter substrate-binding protein [Acidiphilium iwatense]|uniref:TRAP transporter substrate-binding protein n=1 Tax=Acidiphilium iwatense TaxID=768198 RepID=A0ABS9DZX3_9PROT|nr:TRAP transporter substrate-binding protein [Acidiphilium iwatense]MCF3948319.1 TRAP transporter substrate-binding protein [Acidiphilium iwatense]